MAYKQRKRKIKKNVPEGIAHIHATFNNTITTITDNTFIEFRKTGFDEVNDTFNLNIQVEKVEDIKIKSPNIEKKEVN